MHRLNVRARGLAQPLSVDLAPDEAVLLGRSPDPRRLRVSLPAPRVRCVAVPSTQVSVDHALVWMDGDGVWVRDLRSRNGTWSRVAPDEAVRVPGPEFTLELAGLDAATSSALSAPADPTWRGDGDFHLALSQSLSSWFEALGLDAQVLDAAHAPAQGAVRFHLAAGPDLVVVPASDRTHDTRWTWALDATAAFVDTQNALRDQELGHADGFVLRSPALRAAHRKVWDAAAYGRRLLLRGESGTGKERLASCYHRHSKRADAPFKAINCALMEKDMIWVQLFGAARGSYTGAVRDVVGAVEAAHGGTLFLDEVAELSPRMQSALLRFLDRQGEYERLGETRTRRADVQVVCATNADLRDAVARGAFREDLWYRFAASVVTVPPLRERVEDIAAYLDARRLTTGITARQALSADAWRLVQQHPWPGNFRELENFAARLEGTRRPGSVDASAARESLREGMARPVASEPVTEIATGAEGAWAQVLHDAVAGYADAHDGVGPTTYGHLREFIEGHLKPAFMARSAGVAHDQAPGRAVNCSAVGRALGTDDMTVQRLLQRYRSRTDRG